MSVNAETLRNDATTAATCSCTVPPAPTERHRVALRHAERLRRRRRENDPVGREQLIAILEHELRLEHCGLQDVDPDRRRMRSVPGMPASSSRAGLATETPGSARCWGTAPPKPLRPPRTSRSASPRSRVHRRRHIAYRGAVHEMHARSRAPRRARYRPRTAPCAPARRAAKSSRTRTIREQYMSGAALRVDLEPVQQGLQVLPHIHRASACGRTPRSSP